MCESGTVGVALLHMSKRVCPVGMDIGSYFAGHFDEDSLELHSIPVIHWESSPKFPDGEIFFISVTGTREVVSSAELFELCLVMSPSPPCLPITA